MCFKDKPKLELDDIELSMIQVALSHLLRGYIEIVNDPKHPLYTKAKRTVFEIKNIGTKVQVALDALIN